MKHSSLGESVTRDALVSWYRLNRQRTRAIFRFIKDEAYYDRPIALRNPIVFYEGHLPAFAVNTLQKRALQGTGLDAHAEVLFERGIDPDGPDAVKDATDVWPPRAEVQAYGTAADALIERAMHDPRLEDGGVPERRGGEAAFTILEHESMHQETLLYMLHNLPYDRKVAHAPLNASAPAAAGNVERDVVHVPAGMVTLGAEPATFGWDNEFPSMQVHVDAFEVDRHNVTNGDFLTFFEETGAAPSHFWLQQDGAWFWRGLFEPIPLPLDWPVYVTHEQATAYAAWRGKRLMTEPEYHRAAFGTADGERSFPWGEEPPDATRGNFDFASWEPRPIGSCPAGASAWGVHDLIGNGWEWTSTLFDGFPGFEPLPSYLVYSADFFDGKHYVMKGASPVTAKELIRRSFRNWFRPNYPYVYAKFRCASS